MAGGQFGPTGTGPAGANPAIPISAQDPFGYATGFPWALNPGQAANISMSNAVLPDPGTGSRGGGYWPAGVGRAALQAQAPLDDARFGIWGNWAQDSLGYAPRIPTAPDFNSNTPGQG